MKSHPLVRGISSAGQISEPPIELALKNRSGRFAGSIGAAVISAAFALLLTSCVARPADRHPPKIVVLVAASAAEAMKELANQFHRTHPHAQVMINSGASNQLAQQILAGAPADVFLSASPIWSREMESKGLVAEQIELLSNRLVVIVPQGNPAAIAQPADLLEPQIKRLALADKNVPAGMYAEEALEHLGLLDKLVESGKVVRAANVRAVAAYVEEGEVDAGIVYSTDAKASTKCQQALEFDEALHEKIVYPALLLSAAAERQDAQDFFRFLRSEEAAKVFQSYGFLTAAAPSSQAKGASP